MDANQKAQQMAEAAELDGEAYKAATRKRFRQLHPDMQSWLKAMYARFDVEECIIVIHKGEKT